MDVSEGKSKRSRPRAATVREQSATITNMAAPLLVATSTISKRISKSELRKRTFVLGEKVQNADVKDPTANDRSAGRDRAA
jgi:hypothetical protein